MSGALRPGKGWGVARGAGDGVREGWRWGACLALVLLLHVVTGALLLGRSSVTAEPPPTVTPVDMAPPLPELEAASVPPPTAEPPVAALPEQAQVPPPPAAAAAVQPQQASPAEPPPPAQAQPEPPLAPAPEPPSAPEPPAEVALPLPPPPPPPPPTPRPVRPPPRPAPPWPAPPRQADPAPAAEARPAPAPALPAAPAPAAQAARPASSPAALASWQSRLYGHLLRLKRYPAEAQMRRQEGTPVVQFTASRDGRVLSAHLARSSGSELLDQEALALVQRAQPLPPFTEDMPEASRTVAVPVQFSLR